MKPVALKARFLSPLRLEDIDGQHMQLIEPLRFYSAKLRRIVWVSPPFVTDFASIPRGFWNLIPKNGLWDKPAVIHDAAYRMQLRDVTGAFFPATKAQADTLFKEGLDVQGVGTFTRTAMYWAVKLFGHGAWQKAGSDGMAV